MATFNTSGVVTKAPNGRIRRASTPFRTASATSDAVTYADGSAFSMDAQTELFMMLSGSFVNEDSFYERGSDRITRLRSLVRKITSDDASENKAVSGEWFMQFTRWLRTQAFIRTGAVILAVEAVHARLAAHASGFNREIVNFACDRGDEPGELVACWIASYGKPIPHAVKRGLSDAVIRLYNEYTTLRYDSSTNPIRFGDVVELVQPRTNGRGNRNDDLLTHLIDRRHAYNDNDIPLSLTMLRSRANLEAMAVEHRRGVLLANPQSVMDAGFDWQALSGWLQGPMDREVWEAIAPKMGYMATLRNLRNFDESGVSTKAARQIAARLSDPAQVSRSRQLPFRFWTAYREVANDRWKVALSEALEFSTQNIPEALRGRTLVLVDTSGSMSSPVSSRSSVAMHEIAGLFGVSLGMRFGVKNVDLVGFAETSFEFTLREGASVLNQVEAFYRTNGRAGYSTQISRAVSKHYNGHDRVVLISDMQTFGGYGARDVGSLVPAHVPFYAFNLAGYGTTVVNSQPGRYQLGGLSDQTFRYMETVERGLESGWPWELSE